MRRGHARPTPMARWSCSGAANLRPRTTAATWSSSVGTKPTTPKSAARRQGNVQGTVLHFVDVAGRLKTLPGFPQELRRATTPADWDEMVNPTMDKYLHYLLQWHSTALSLADFVPSDTGDDYPFVVFASDGESLFDQVEREAAALVPVHHLECNRQGQLAVVADEQLLDAGDRLAGVQNSFVEYKVEQIRFTYRARRARIGCAGTRC